MGAVFDFSKAGIISHFIHNSLHYFLLQGTDIGQCEHCASINLEIHLATVAKSPSFFRHAVTSNQW